MLSDRIRHVRPRRRTANFRDPRLAPGGDWDGTPGSGFASAPSDPTRTTAKTAVRLVTVPNQRMVITHQVFVSAFAINDGALDGGIDRVRFHLEGNTLEVTEPTLRTFTRADDSEYLAFGYSANIGRASSANGKAHLYVEAIPADATMQSRVIGPFLYSFGDALFDHDVEVAATPDEITGQRYKTLEAAINWLKAQTPDAARIRITEGGTYLVEENSTNHTFDNWLMIEGAAGVTATLARSSYVGDAANRFFIRSGNVAFRNLTFDMRYITGIHSVPNTPFWADRCTFTNTDPDQEYAKWRGALRANAFLFETPTYFTDCEIEYLPNVFGTEAELCRGNIARDGYADLAGDAKAMLGNVVRGWDSSAWLLGEDAFSVTYDGVEATATLSAPIAQGNTRVLTAEWGANSATLTVGRTEDDWDGTTGNAYWPSDVVDWINDTLAAQDAGWSATLLDDTLAAYYINIDRDDPEFSGGANGNASALEVSVKDVTKTIKCNFDIHADGYQDRVGGLSENVIIAGEDWQIAGQLFFSSSTTPAHDYAVINNVFRFLDTEAEYLSPESQLADDAKSHVILAHNSWIDQRLLLRWDDDLTLDAYCLIANNVAEDIVDVGTSTAPEGVIVGNHLYSGSPANAANTSTGGDADSLFEDAANGDFTPAGALLTSGKAPVLNRDLGGNVRKAIEVMGAIGSGELTVTEYTPPVPQTEWNFDDFTLEEFGTGSGEIVSESLARTQRTSNGNETRLTLALYAGTYRIRCTLAEWTGNGAAQLRLREPDGATQIDITIDSGAINYFQAGAVDTTWTFAEASTLILRQTTNGRSAELTKGADPVVEKIS